MDNIENKAILKGVLVSPFAKKIGVKILCNTKAGKPKAYITNAEAVFLLSILENSPLSNNTVIMGYGKIIKATVAGKINIDAILNALWTTWFISETLSNRIFSDNLGKSTLPNAIPTTPKGSWYNLSA